MEPSTAWTFRYRGMYKRYGCDASGVTGGVTGSAFGTETTGYLAVEGKLFGSIKLFLDGVTRYAELGKVIRIVIPYHGRRGHQYLHLIDYVGSLSKPIYSGIGVMLVLFNAKLLLLSSKALDVSEQL
ncbi:hypothetical protein NECAME_09493 [Necator americanus]|uniref:Uncharacterized protein n=1 Tax=Necator americanus TaxID=51031 RepID=W2TFY5_NECAM|nr:hypothetical protein NECAME_09493 [Necator americanus]ETN79922.1 hypothetical protein NECAME_09493 [Necator americanus]